MIKISKRQKHILIMLVIVVLVSMLFFVENIEIIKNIKIDIILIDKVFYYISHSKKDRILDQFANNLYNYPLPANTVLLEKTKSQADNYKLGFGNGEYRAVVATMKLSTRLSREEIEKHYKKVMLPFPKENAVINDYGVDIQLFFEDEADRMLRDRGRFVYYERRNSGLKIKNPTSADRNSLIYIIQIRSGY